MTSPFDIKSINLFSSWVYNLPKNTDCTICRCNLNVSSLYNQEKGIESIVVTGICDHSFHYDCIKPWVDQNNHCPICSVKWQYQQQPVEKIIKQPVEKIIKQPVEKIINQPVEKIINQPVEKIIKQHSKQKKINIIVQELEGIGGKL
jgi:hypothetical protein